MSDPENNQRQDSGFPFYQDDDAVSVFDGKESREKTYKVMDKFVKEMAWIEDFELPDLTEDIDNQSSDQPIQ
jgi:hypothetical protein